jgi:toxin-antitoxin system PIN domain toxin
MLCIDVNVLVYAHRREAERHDEYRGWLDAARKGAEPVGVSDLVLSGFIRVVTHPRVFVEPTPLATALAFAEVLRTAPAAVKVSPGPRHWELFRALCQNTGARGNAIPDTYLAALAIELGATWISADRGFSRFSDLRWRHPLDPAA